MNIKTRLLLQFSLIVVTILLVFTTGVFYFSSSYRKSEYYSRLEDRAHSFALLLLEEKVGEEMLKVIDKRSVALFQERLTIYDGYDYRIYENNLAANITHSDSLLREIRKKRVLRYFYGDHEALGITYRYNGQDYVIIVSAFDKYGFSKLSNLKIVLFIGFLFGVLATIMGGAVFARRALAPISDVIGQVNSITGTNLSQRVDEGNKKDEIALLAITFNLMLDRIESAFILQKEFVTNAAHELRTPFTVLLAEADYTLMHERDNEHYKQVLRNFSDEIRKLGKLSNGLLELARISIDNTGITTGVLRMDEVLMEVCNAAALANSSYSISLDLDDLPDHERLICFQGNEQLLTIAFMNIIDNACKFSEPKAVRIKVVADKGYVAAKFSDTGIGIHKEDIEMIFQPFYRGKNTHYIAGYGIGLALTLKITELHHGQILVTSEPGSGSEFTLQFPVAIIR
jgi:signal transduction histidine kinase